MSIELNQKKPDRERCPCCEALAINFARPVCKQYGYEYFYLFWKCEVCGAEWEHEGKKQEGGARQD